MSDYFNFNCDLITAHYSHDKFPKKERFFLHTHDTCELYCFFGGKGTFKVEGNSYELKKGDILIMRPGEAHYIDIDFNEPYTRAAVNFNTELFSTFGFNEELLAPFINRDYGQLNIYRSSDFRNNNYRIFLENLIAPSRNRQLQLISNLLPLLNEINIAFENRHIESYKETRIQKIIGYINNRLSEKIILEDICNEFYISYPQLCRIFKTATGSTVGEYITAKRLVMAQGLIRAGIPPTKVYSECGFGDYSAFYRAYKKRFGVSPKNI